MQNFDKIFYNSEILLVDFWEVSGRSGTAQRKELISHLNNKNTTKVKSWTDSDFAETKMKGKLTALQKKLKKDCEHIVNDGTRKGHSTLAINVKILYSRGFYRKEIASKLGKSEREIKDVISKYIPDYNENNTKNIIRNINTIKENNTTQLRLFD